MTKLNVNTDVPTEIKMTRDFAAPRRLVRRAMSEPELIKRWQGNSCSPIVSVEVDFRVGGKYRYVYRTPDGNEFSFAGEFQEISEDRTVHTEHFNGMPDGATITTTLVDNGNNTTTMIAVMAFSSQEVRDMVIKTGMEKGAAESYDNLDKLVRNL
jgi:uncharacterized protein YndB with AHSA1/START domain